MARKGKTKEELIEEIRLLQNQIAELKTRDIGCKWAEEALRQDEAILTGLFSVVPVGICLMKDKVYQSVNKYWCKHFGYSEEEIIGKSTRMLYESDAEYERVGAELYAHLWELGFSSVQSRLRCKNGLFYDVLLTAAPLQIKNPGAGAIVVIEDMTERRQAEEILRNKTAILEAQMNSSIDGILVVDKQGKKILQNKRTVELWKIPQHIADNDDDEMQVQHVKNMTKNPQKFIEKVRYLYNYPNETSQDEVELIDGMVLDRYSAPVLGEDGKNYGRIWIFRDITDRKKAENMLIQSEKLASLGRLVTEIAHEVNNPLMIISGNAQLSLMSKPLSEEAKNNLAIIIEECQRARSITQRLLKFSRPSKGDTQNVDINKSIEVMAGLVEYQFKLANVKIKREYAEDLPLISIDEQQMQEVFINIMNNAKDAMPGGGIITITTFSEGNFLRIDFRDTGSGMPEEVVQKIFEPFFTTKEKGTGLGLPVCYGIIKAHNGDLKFQSELNKGTTASILLPWGEIKHDA